MKAYEVLVEYKIEKPAGVFSQGLKKVGAATLGALGAKNAADALKVSADIGDRANAYEKEFQKYLSSKGKNTIDIEYVDLNNFIRQNSLPSPKLPSNGYVATGDLENIFMDIAKMSVNTEPTNGQSSTTAGTGQQLATSQTATKPANKTSPVIQKPAQQVKPTTTTPAVTTTTSGTITADQLLSAFQEYIDADGKITPELRGAVKALWMKMGGVKAESTKKAKI